MWTFWGFAGFSQTMRPYLPPDLSNRAALADNHIHIQLRFGYLRDKKDAESLRARSEYNEQGYLTLVHEFDPVGGIALRREYEYAPDAKTVVRALIEEIEANGNLKYSCTYQFDPKGRVQLYTETNGKGEMRRVGSTYDEKGNLLSEQTFEPDGMPGPSATYAYNDVGRCTVRENYDIAGDVTTRFEWTYDEKGRKIKETQLLNGSFLLFEINFQYDEKGRLIRQETLGHSGNLTTWESWAYDAGGRITEHLELERGETQPMRETIRYDKSGRKIESIQYLADGNIFQWYKYQHDSLGAGAGFERLLPDGKTDAKLIVQYNSKRQVIEQLEHYPDGSGDTKTSFEYGDDGLLLRARRLDFGDEESVYWFVYDRW
jgi:antitoxin component YwqK of YwqJK toxin-antitoxin module